MARGYFCGGGFSGVDCDDATAVEEDILEGRTAGISGKDDLVQGRMPERGDWGSTELAAGESVIIPGGHHSGKGKVVAKSLAAQTPGNLAANKMLAGTYGWSNGKRLSGEIDSQGAMTIKPGTKEKTGSVSGKYMTGNITVPAISIPASAIKKGHKITFPDGSSITGTFEGWVPTPQDLYYNGVNIAGFKFPQDNSSVWKEENNRLTNRVGSGYIQFTKSINVTTYSKLIVEGRLHAHLLHGGGYSDIKVGISKYAQSNYAETTFDGASLVTSVTLDIEHVSTIGVNDIIRFNNMRNADQFSDPPEEPNIITRIRLA